MIAIALTGLFYCLTAAVVVLAFNRALIANWALATLSVVAGSLFAVSVGLLMGTLFEVKQQLTLWGLVVANVLLVPLFLSVLIEILPAGAARLLSWMPVAAVGHLLRVSFSASPPVGQYLPQLALVTGYTLLLLAAVTWGLRRLGAE